MSYLQPIEKAMNYIESHLFDDIDLSIVAKESGYSLYHFHRVFKSIVGDSLKDYIRMRRITEAAKRLVYTNTPIIDIAIKHGYESRESFSRAFEKVYGRNPSEVRKSKLLYSIREPIDFDYILYKYNQSKKGLTPLYKRLPERYVVGKRKKMKSDGSNLQDIPLLWNKWNSENSSEIIERKYQSVVMGICIFSDGDEFEYMIGNEVNSNSNVPENMELYRLESSLYAIFETIGPITENVQKTWDYIYSVWLIESEYKHAGIPDIEYYYMKKGELTVDLYVPIVCKK